MEVRTGYHFRSSGHLANQPQMQMRLRQIREPETTMTGIGFRDFVGCQIKIGGQSISMFGI
eukprot:2760256-Pyramimonas_sp.AAC.1